MVPKGFARRSIAAGVHLLISACLIGLIAVLVFNFWFPYPFRELAGGTELFLLISWVDIILGPLLTFVIYDTRKKQSTLTVDIISIGVVQLSALLYGLHTVNLARPIYLVHEVDRIQVVLNADIAKEDLERAAPAFRSLPAWNVRLIGVREPRNDAELLQSIELAMAGHDAAMRPEWWQEINSRHLTQMHQRSLNLSELRHRFPEATSIFDEILRRAVLTDHDVLTLPVINRDKVWTVVLDRKSANIVGYVPVDPF